MSRLTPPHLSSSLQPPIGYDPVLRWHVQAWDDQVLRNERELLRIEEAQRFAVVWSEEYPLDTIRLANWLEDGIWIYRAGRVVREGTFASTTMVQVRA